MLRDLRLTFRLFRRNVLFVLLFLIEILLAFMLIFASYNRYTEKKDPLDFVNSHPELHRSIVAFVRRFSIDDEQAMYDEPFRSLADTEGYIGEADIFFSEWHEQGKGAQLLLYDPFTAEICFPALKAGRYPKATTEEDTVEVLSLDDGRGGGASTTIGSEIMPKEGAYKKLRVVGTASLAEAVLLNKGTSFYSGEGLDLTIMFTYRHNVDLHFLGVQDNLKGNSNAFHLFYFAPETPEEVIAKRVEELNEQFPAYSIKALSSQTEKILDERLKNDMPMNVTLGLLLLSGIFSMSVLNLFKSVRQFQVFRLVGASRQDCERIYFLSFVLLFATALLLFFLVMKGLYFLDHSGRQYVYYIRPALKWGLIGGSIVLSVLCSLPIVWVLRKDREHD